MPKFTRKYRGHSAKSMEKSALEEASSIFGPGYEVHVDPDYAVYPAWDQSDGPTYEAEITVHRLDLAPVANVAPIPSPADVERRRFEARRAHPSSQPATIQEQASEECEHFWVPGPGDKQWVCGEDGCSAVAGNVK